MLRALDFLHFFSNLDRAFLPKAPKTRAMRPFPNPLGQISSKRQFQFSHRIVFGNRCLISSLARNMPRDRTPGHKQGKFAVCVRESEMLLIWTTRVRHSIYWGNCSVSLMLKLVQKFPKFPPPTFLFHPFQFSSSEISAIYDKSLRDTEISPIKTCWSPSIRVH